MEHDTSSEKKQEETSDSSSSSVESETVVAIREDESSKPETDSLGAKELTGVEQKADSIAADSVIEVRDIGGTGDTLSGESINEEKVCRICHLSSENMSGNSSLIELGCSCKHELGISHKHCATAWFERKGNRLCEICGETAKNVTYCGESRVAVESSETRLTAGGTRLPADETRLPADGWNDLEVVDGRVCFCCTIFLAVFTGFSIIGFPRVIN